MSIRKHARRCVFERNKNGAEVMNPRVFFECGEVDGEALVREIEGAMADILREQSQEVRPGIYRLAKSEGCVRVEGVARAYNFEPKGGPFLVVASLPSEMLHVIPVGDFKKFIDDGGMVFVEPA